MKYTEMKYERPDIQVVGAGLKQLINDFNSAENFERQDSALKKINDFRKEFDSMMAIAYINYSNNTQNREFEEEQNYFDDNIPMYEDYLNEFYKSLIKSKFKKKFEEKYGKFLFDIAAFKTKIVSKDVIEELKKENHLSSMYRKLKSSAEIDFDGKKLNLQELEPYLKSNEREVRKKASIAFWNFFEINSEEFDSIYDKLVHLRHDIAQKLGYESFVELGYQRMERFGYDENDVKKFRESIKKHIVPLTIKIREKQRKRLGLDKMKSFDYKSFFKNGNASPKGNPEWITKNGKRMYEELSTETGEFYNFMTDNELMDVDIRKGKDPGGFCSYISKYKSPYIFSNMNGTEEDIVVLTHEAGHAFQAYSSRDIEITEYLSPSSEACEIHSMSMEFITHRWMDLFFKDETEKFKYTHLTDSILFIPYGVLVDDFQHWVYKNIDASPLERKAKWRELEEIYTPGIDYDGNEFLEMGSKWQRQSHIYENPFYYIDYCLAQVCAFQFWSKIFQKGESEFGKALTDYIKLCKAGGTKPFLELVEFANLKSPFEENVIKNLASEMEMYLESIDDSKL